MRSQRRVPQPGSPSTSSPSAKHQSQVSASLGPLAGGALFLEVQAESGRRMRPVVAEHYGEAE